MCRFSRNTFELRKIADSFKHHCVSLSDASKHILFTLEGEVENLTSGQSNTMIDLCKLTLTPEVAPAVTSSHTFDTREVEFAKCSKYGISYAPDTELACRIT